MGARWPRLEFRMELAPHEPRMLLEFDDFHELAVRAQAGQAHAPLHELVAVLVGDLVAMAMPLADLRHAIHLGDFRSTRESRGVRTEPHRAAHVSDVLL